MQFWSEIILVISNRTRAARSFDFEISRMISAQIALHSVQLPLLIIPKLVYISSLLPTPKEIIQELNQLLFKFLWKGTDKTTRLSVINEYENGGLKMIDLESMPSNLLC